VISMITSIRQKNSRELRELREWISVICVISGFGSLT
jgi:hypothetical protein